MSRVANFQHFGETFFKSPNIDTYMSVCVCPAAAGRLGRRCHRRHLCGRQQQVQTDGLWLRQVLFFFFSVHFLEQHRKVNFG